MTTIKTVGDMRRELEGLPKDMPIVVAMQSPTQVYPAEYVTPWGLTMKQGPEACIMAMLPTGTTIVDRRKR